MRLPEAWSRPRLLVPALLGTIVVLAFLPSLRNGFVNWDDYLNLRDNPSYRGLGPDQLRWMWSTFRLGHYQPLSWMTLGLDYVVWGMNPLGYHLSSLLLHAANTVLLYRVILALLRHRYPEATPWPAFAGALVHALHPLRVESVVWATERRDVLCGFFALLSVLAYLRRVEEERQGRPAARWLVLSCVAFGASLLSKALSITLPAVLLVLDVFPLGRFQRGSRLRLLLEKVPYGLLACADAVIMIFAMRHIDAVRTVAGYDVVERAAQAAYGLCFYLVKSIWPVGLIPIYRLDVPLDPWRAKYIVPMLAVAGGTAALWALRRRFPAGLAAWTCYAVLLFPVLGVAVTGQQIAADRYTYLAMMPAAVLAAAGLERLFQSGSPARSPIIAAVTGSLVLLAIATIRQTAIWKDSESLWSHELRFDPGCAFAYNIRGAERQDRGDSEGAVADSTQAIDLGLRSADVYLTRGLARARLGDIDGSIRDFNQILQLDPRSAKAYQNRGLARFQKRDLDGASADLTEALQLGGQNAECHAARGRVRGAKGDLKGAVDDLESALRAAPDDWAQRRDTQRMLDGARRQLRGN